MPAIWAAELLAVTVIDFTEVCYFIGCEGVFENNIAVLTEMWEKCLEGICRLGSVIRFSSQKQSLKSGLVQIMVNYKNE